MLSKTNILNLRVKFNMHLSYFPMKCILVLLSSQVQILKTLQNVHLIITHALMISLEIIVILDVISLRKHYSHFSINNITLFHQIIYQEIIKQMLNMKTPLQYKIIYYCIVASEVFSNFRTNKLLRKTSSWLKWKVRGVINKLIIIIPTEQFMFN